MRTILVVLLSLAACGGRPPAAWPVPPGWRKETIPFPLEFAPTLAHRGVEELRFAPGFLRPGEPGYWSYAFVWRLEDAADLDGDALGRELTDYFRGLIAAVDEKKQQVAARDEIVARAEKQGGAFALRAHVFDAFNTGGAIDLTGFAERRSCGTGSLWVFVLAPEKSPLREELDRLARAATCATGG